MVRFVIVSRGGDRRYLDHGCSLEIWEHATMRADLNLELLYDFVMGMLAHDTLTEKVRASIHIRKPPNRADEARQQVQSAERRSRKKGST